MVRDVLMLTPMRRPGLGLALGVSFAAALFACGASRLPAPPYVAHPTEALQQVAFPPPPARVEYVPPSPKSGAVWVDGEWTWQTDRWAWKRGRWVMPLANARYSPWTSSRDRSGTLYVAEGRWRDDKLRELPEPAPLATGKTRGGAVTNAEGDTLPTTPNVPLDRPPVLPDASADTGLPPDAGGSDAMRTPDEPQLD